MNNSGSTTYSLGWREKKLDLDVSVDPSFKWISVFHKNQKTNPNLNVLFDMQLTTEDVIPTEKDMHLVDMRALDNKILTKEAIQEYQKDTFALFKKIETIKNNIIFCTLKIAQNPLSSICEGTALSLSKEKSNFLACSLEIGSIDDLTRSLIHSCCTKRMRYAYKKGVFYEDALDQTSLTENVALKKKGVYVLFGAGKIARSLTQYLTKQYHARIVVVGRNHINTAQEEEWRALGAILYASVDVGSVQPLKQLRDYIQKSYGVINGIFYLAGAIEDKLFCNKSLHSYERVLLSKSDWSLLC